MAGKRQWRIAKTDKKASAGDKTKSSVTFDSNDELPEIKDVDVDAMDTDGDDDDEFQQLVVAYKTQVSKASNNGKAVHAKANILFMRTRSQLTALKSEFDGFIDHVRQNMQELHEQERTLPLEQLAAMFGQRNKTQLTALLDIYQDALPETSQLSAKQIELFRNDVQKIRRARSKAFRQSVSDAKAIVNRTLEEQKLAADSAALIKNFAEIVKI